MEYWFSNKNLVKVFIFSLLFHSFCGFSQSTNNITINVSNQPLKEVLKQIELQTVYRFVYSNTEIDVERKVSYKANNKELNEVLAQFLSTEKLDFQIKRNHIIITPAKTEEPTKEPRKFTGTVYDSKENFPIPGVNVLVAGLNIGTTTDSIGNFSISIPEGKHALIFSFIGYSSKEVLLDRALSSSLSIFLHESTLLLDEVIFYAYGKDSKRLISSAISNVKANQLTEFPSPGIIESLKGNSTGLNINKNSGTPGGAMTLRIRGISSIAAGADPLYVIDGVPLITQDLSLIVFGGQGVNTISNINPADVESVSILKDASATAIYGARGSNGVVLITTKRGRSQDPKIRFNLSLGLQEVSRTYQMLNAEQFMRYKNSASINDGGTVIYTEDIIASNSNNTDWQKELYKVAPIKNYDLSISGGSESSHYYISGNHFNQDGIAMGTNFVKYGARFNFDQKVSKRLCIGTSISLSKTVNNRKEGDQSLNSPVAMALSRYPIYPIYNTNGTFNEDGPNANPISIAKQHINVTYNWHTIGNVFLNYKIYEGLTYKAKYGIDYINFREHTFDPPTTRQGAKYQGLGIESTSEVEKKVFSNILSYTKSVTDKQSVDIIVGNEIEQGQRSSTYLRGEVFPSNQLEYLISSAEKISADAFLLESAIISYFGRAKYNFNNKYIVTFNSRFDGSSRFSNKNKYGLFPSGDFLWRISDEKFFSIKAINDFKLRVSYGVTGNDKIPDFLYITRFSASEYDNLSALYPVNISNPDLRWESTNQFNLGVDASFFKSRISISADYYYKKTKDLLFNKPTPPSSGFSSVVTNIGKLENKGFEFAVNTINTNKALRWESAFNISFNQNKVTELYKNQPIDNIGRGSQRIEVGEPIGIFYGYKSLGVDPATGDIIFEDFYKDGIIDVRDRQKIGSPHPLFEGGLSNSLSYANFDLNIFVQFCYGNKIFNGTRRYIEISKSNNQSSAVLNRWENPGDISDIPRATNLDPNENNRVSSRFIEDGSFVKLKSLKLAYNLNFGFTQKLNVSQFNVFIQAQNLYTLTKFSGMDPEVNYAGPDVIRSGVEFFTYPTAKVYSFGLSIEF
jgi:TonB-linked SusC/RagA family outer membrane protein